MKNLGLIHFSAAKVVAVFAFCLAIVSTTSATGVLDNTFGTNGKVITDFGQDSQINSIIVQPDGKIVAAGAVIAANGYFDIALARYNSNGSLDATFGNGGKVVSALTEGNDIAFAVTLQADGKIVIAGQIASDGQNPIYDFLVARYHTNGSLDTGFGNNGIATVNQGQQDIFHAVAVRSDGKIVAAGDYGFYSPAVIGFNSNGTLDLSFANQGLFYPSIPNLPIWSFRGLGLQSNGNIIVGGTALPPQFTRKNLLIALDSNGRLVQSFGTQGLAISDGGIEGHAITDLMVKPDGKIVTVGQIPAQYSANGIYEGRFFGGRDGDVAILPSGKIVSTSSNYTTVAPAEFVSLSTASGQFIGRADLGITYVTDVATQTDNKIIAAGMSHVNPINNSGQRNFVLIRYSAVTSQGTRLFNSELGAKTNIGVYRPSNQTFYILSSYNGEILARTAVAPVTGIIPENFRLNYSLPTYWSAPNANAPGVFYGEFDFNGGVDAFQWGSGGDIPVGGDYDGDGVTDFTVFRPSNGTWYISQSSNNQFRAIQFGTLGDKLVPAEYDYDGITDIAVWRPASGVWYVLRSSDSGLTAVQFGANGDVPVTGDFDGDGRADFVVFRPSNGVWYLFNTTEGFRAVQFGVSIDQPVPGDYDGDGRHDIAVFRNGVWYLLQSRDGFRAVQWGLANDIPVAVRY